MTFLYIDTSSSYLYTAIIKDNNTIAEIKKDYGQQLSARALVEIANMFDTKSISPKEIDKIIVVNGPGSFTGIRIGITIAKVYAWSLNIPITSISSLDAMAISSDIDTYKIPILDARRGYVYAAIYDKNNDIVFKPSHIKIEELYNEVIRLNETCTVITNDDTEFYNLEKIKYDPDIRKIVEIKKNKASEDPHQVNPIYLKQTEAEEKNNDN